MELPTPQITKTWHNNLSWFCFISIFILELTGGLGFKFDLNNFLNDHEKRVIMSFWTPADTVHFREEYEELDNILIEKAGGWTRTYVEGGSKKSQRDPVCYEKGYLYFVSVHGKTPGEVAALRDEISSLITTKSFYSASNPLEKAGFDQLKAYIEVFEVNQ